MHRMTSPLTLYRNELGLSVEALAERLGVERTTVWRWERGRVPADRLRTVERLTGIPRETLRPDLYEAAQ